MKKAMLPLNIVLLEPTAQQLSILSPVTVTDIFEGPGGNFHDDGLFSTTIFGRVGDRRRSIQEGYIPLKLPVLHPAMYSRLIRLKRLYGDILAGREYAVFNPTTLDFERSDQLNGRTGYSFFCEHWSQLSPKKTGSATRDARITLLEKYRNNGALLTNLLVLPAGLRDAELGADGRVSMDEINELYQQVLVQTRALPEYIARGETLENYDRIRMTITLRIEAIYDYLTRIVSGKRGYINDRFASRRVVDGTRNVLSSMNTTVPDLDAPNYPGFNSIVVGMYQVAKALLPKTLYFLKQGIVGEVFDTTTNRVELVDPTTLQRRWVDLDNTTMDRWTTTEGLEKVINELQVVEKRSRPVEIEGHYLALLYTDNEQNFRIVRSITELPSEVDEKQLRPITYLEMIYLSGYREWNKYPMYMCRYPIENYLSSYPAMIYVKTTTVGDLRYELGPDGERLGDDYCALEFPRRTDQTGGATYHDSVSVSPGRLVALGAD